MDWKLAMCVAMCFCLSCRALQFEAVHTMRDRIGNALGTNMRTAETIGRQLGVNRMNKVAQRDSEQGKASSEKAGMPTRGRKEDPQPESELPLHEEHQWPQGGVNIPSLISAVFRRAESHDGLPRNCHLPGQSGNVVRSLRNRGQVIHEEIGLAITELRYSFRDVFMDYENVISAVVHASPPAPELHHRHHWTNRYAGSSFSFRVHWLSHQNWNALDNILKSNVNSSTLQHQRSKQSKDDANILAKIDRYIGRPIATRSVSYAYGHVNTQTTETLDVTQVITRWRRESLRHRGRPAAMSRTILIVTEDKDSSFSLKSSDDPTRWTSAGSCMQPTQAVLILVSLDSDQCKSPTEETLSTADSETRLKRDVGDTNSRGNVNSARTSSSSSANIKRNREGSVVNTQVVSDSASTQAHHVRNPRSSHSSSTICQRHSMWVDFADLGWTDWVIAPRAFQAYRCAGECPYRLAAQLNGTNHAMLMAMMNSIDGGNSPMPCCVPTSLSAVSLLYLDNSDNVVLRQYEDMVIDTCGCR